MRLYQPENWLGPIQRKKANKMRLDLFLKTARIIKRRTLAKEAVEKDRVKINDKPAKPSTTVKVLDVLALRLGQKTITLKVLSLNPKETMYELL